jgi:predicted secreted protein
MNARFYRRSALIVALSLIMPVLSYAQDSSGQGGDFRAKNRQALQEFKYAQHKKSKEYTERGDEETKAFLKSIAGKSKENMLSAIKEFKTGHYIQNCAFREKMYQDWRAFVERLLDSSPNTSPAMKERILAQVNQDYEELKAFHVQKQEENMAFIDKLKCDDSIKEEELTKALQDFFQSQKADAEKFIEQQRERSSARLF